METAPVALQVVIGKNNHVYRKMVSMPILPVGSVVRFNQEQRWYIQGYWWEDGLTIAWLAHWRHLDDNLKRAARNGENCPSLLTIDLEKLPIEYKETFASLGFEWTTKRIETF